MTLETYKGLYVDLSDLSWEKIDKERSQLKKRYPYLGPDARFIYRKGMGSYRPPTQEEYKRRQREREALRYTASELGRRGGQSTSPAKVSASRSNGKLGGRPKKTIVILD
jgi:hypothetical protein